MTPTKSKSPRQQLTEELQRRSVQLFASLASIGDAVITTDNTGDVTFLNPMAESLTGWSLEEAVGLDIGRVFQVIDESTGEPIPSSVQESIKRISKIILPPNAILIKRDGSRIPIDDSAAPILDSDNYLLGAVLVFRDITEKKKAEQMVKFRSEIDRMAARISTKFITSQVSNVDDDINAALKEIGQILRADRSYVALFSNDDAMINYTYEWYSTGIEPLKCKAVSTAAVPYWSDKIRGREYIFISSEDEIPPEAIDERVLWEYRDLKTLMSVPMMQEDKVIGFIGINAIIEAKPWPEDVIDLLYLIGNVFASAMGRRDAMQKLEDARAREVEIGSRIQQSLLISEPPYLFADFQIAALTIPSRKIDGDFYDFLPHPNRCLDIIFGDVMGKGVPAALLAAGSKTEFLHSLSHLLASSRRGVIPRPQDIVNSVHKILTPQLMELDSFVTLSYVRFDPEASKITLVDCGNTRILRCVAATGAIEHLSGFNVPLGFWTSEVYSQAEFPFSPDDVFVLYSDGATEARNEAGEMFGIRRLSDLIVEKRALSPHQMVDSIKKTVKDFVGDGELKDDFTCVVVKIVSDTRTSLQPAVDELEIPSNLSELANIRDFLRGFCELRNDCGLTEEEIHLLELASTEVASNIMKHAYRGVEGQPVWIRIDLTNTDMAVKFTHNGEPFANPEQIQKPSFNGSREGGFGLFIINKSVDEISYGTDSEGRQFIELIKKLSTRGGKQNDL